MTPADINTIISRLKGDTRCLLPNQCTSQHCSDWKVLVAYIRKVEDALYRTELAQQEIEEHGDNPVYRCLVKAANKTRKALISQEAYQEWLKGDF